MRYPKSVLTCGSKRKMEPDLVRPDENSTIGSISLPLASFFFEIIKADKTDEVVKVNEVSAKWAPGGPDSECEKGFRF